MIEVKGKKRLGNFLLEAELKDENFICLCGKNGSGKSSLLNLIAGIYQPDEGYVKINSSMINDVPPEKKEVVLVTPDSCIPHLDVDKHLAWGAKLKKAITSDDQIAEVKKEFGINFSGKVSKLSLGMRERVSLATAILSSPKVILVDEAFANLDNRSEFIKKYKEVTRSSKIDVLFSTQNANDSSIADHFYNIENGHLTRIF